MNTILEAIIWILPAYIANSAPPIFGGGTPIDMGKNFVDGKRWLGKGKTVRGALIGVFLGALVGYVVHDLTLGILLAFGAVAGDIVASFIKRRVGIKSGGPLWVVDQTDFLVGALLFASLYKLPSLRLGLIIFLITPLLHVGTNFIAYKLGFKKVWW